MVLKELSLKNVRVFEDVKIDFNSHLNIIHGLNGQGKTSLLEAIYYLSLTKSFRVNQDETVLKHDSEYFEIKGSYINTEANKFIVRIFYSNSEGKHAFINSNKVKQFSEVVGKNPVILLSLDDLEITYGVPAARRKFLDILLSQLYPTYLHCLRNYKKSVSQKNKLLSNNIAADKNELDIWNQQLVTYGSQIIFYRLKFLEFANNTIEASYLSISGKSEKIAIRYISTLNEISYTGEIEEIKTVFLENLKNSTSTEIRRKVSLVGPHKDDLGFYKDGYPFKTHGSQGENKSLLLALKINESLYIQEIIGSKPLFLLDDIFGELDNERINNLMGIIKKEGQTFITTTEINKFKQSVPSNTKFIHIKEHAIH